MLGVGLGSVAAAAPASVASDLRVWYDVGQLNSYPGTGTTLSDISGSGDHATLTNGPTYSSTNGGVLTFDRTDDYVISSSSANTVFNPTTGYTIGSWVYPEFNSTDFTDQIGANIAGRVNPASNSDISFALLLGYGSFGMGAVQGIVFVYNQLNSFGFIATTNRWTNNAWNFIMAGHSGSTVKIWVNGTHIGTITGIASNSINYTAHRYTLGYQGSNTFYRLRGKIAASYAYNRLLSDAEVLQNYDTNRGRFGL
jgi:hypothetical protein